MAAGSPHARTAAARRRSHRARTGWLALVCGAAIVAAVLPALGAGATGALTDVSFVASSSATGASGTSYTFTMKTASAGNVSSITMTVPAGTTGVPSVGSTSIQPTYLSFASAAVALSDDVLTFSFTSIYVPSGASISVEIDGLTNSTTAGSYTSEISTESGSSTLDTATTPAFVLSAATATDGYSTASSSLAGATGVTDRFQIVTATTASLSAITVSVPPGTGGSPTVVAASPSSIAGGTISLAGQLLTYSFASVSLSAGTAIDLQIGGLTNTTTTGEYPGELVTYDGAAVVDSGVLPGLWITPGALSALSWSASSTSTSATGVDYTYGFSAATSVALSSVTMSVPPGTSGSPVVGSVSAQTSYSITLASPAVSLSGTTLTVSFTSVYIPAGTVISVEIDGLTNSSLAASYASQITTMDGASPVDSGDAPAVTFTAAALASLSWSASTTSVGATGADYTFSFSLSGAATLSSVTMSVPPGTAGTPSVGTVSPEAIDSGSVVLSGQTLTYTFPATAIGSGATVSIELDGFTNTSTAGVYASTITAFDGSTAIASGGTPSVSFTSTALTSLSWSASSTSTGATGIDYTFGFTTASATSLSNFEMTVPAGTGGEPTIDSVSAYSSSQGQMSLADEQVSLSGTTLTFSFTSVYFASSTVVSVEVGGLTNTSAAGTYTSAITTRENTTAIDSGTTPSLSFNSSVLESPTWSASSTGISGSPTSYTYGFELPTSATITTVTMTVPSGTSGTPSLGPVSPATVSGGTISLSGTTLTYSLAASAVTAGTTVSIEVDGLTNTASAGSYASTLTVSDDGTPIASGTTPAVTFTSTVLQSLTWSVSSTIAGASGVDYTYGFTTDSTATLTTVTMTVPSGTSGTPSVGTLSAHNASDQAITLSSPSVVFSSTTLTLSFSGVYVPSGSVFSLEIDGLTNTASPGSYTAALATKNDGATVDSGTTPAVSLFAASVTGTAPTSLSWSGSLTGTDLDLVDENTADQSYAVADETGTARGWNVSVAATSFTSDGHTLPDAGTLTVNGSLSDPNATSAPSSTCLSTCTTPSNTVAYPVSITTAASSPVSTEIYNAQAGSGSGSFEIGGADTAHPLGWWISLPANAYSGTYSSTITISVESGP